MFHDASCVHHSFHPLNMFQESCLVEVKKHALCPCVFFHCLMVHGPGSGRKDGWIFTGRCGSGSEYSKAHPLWTMLIALIKKKSGEANKHILYTYNLIYRYAFHDVISKESWPCQVVSGETKDDDKELLFGDEFAVSSLNSFEGISLRWITSSWKLLPLVMEQFSNVLICLKVNRKIQPKPKKTT